MIIKDKEVSLKDTVCVEMSIGEIALFATLLGGNITEDVIKFVERSPRLKKKYTSELKDLISNESLDACVYNELSNFFESKNIFI